MLLLWRADNSAAASSLLVFDGSSSFGVSNFFLSLLLVGTSPTKRRLIFFFFFFFHLSDVALNCFLDSFMKDGELLEVSKNYKAVRKAFMDQLVPFDLVKIKIILQLQQGWIRFISSGLYKKRIAIIKMLF